MENTKNTLLIIDGHNLLFQMFYGMPARIRGKKGNLIHGTLGFTGALLKMINLVNPTHVVAVFDGEHENERTQIDADYKANRPDLTALDEEDNPFSQLSDIYNVLDYLKITHFECEQLEADDMIASYALTYGKDNKVIISSADSDFYQLLSQNVNILRYRGSGSIVATPEFLFEKFGILPDVYADFKALCGDGADNVKGAPGIGPKTASKLLNEFGTLEGVLDGAKTLKEGKIKTSLLQNADKLRRNHSIIKLCIRTKPYIGLGQIQFESAPHTTKEVLSALDLL